MQIQTYYDLEITKVALDENNESPIVECVKCITLEKLIRDYIPMNMSLEDALANGWSKGRSIGKVLYQYEYKLIPSSNTVIIYHSRDWDGFTSAAVAKLARPNAKLLGWNYGDQLPDISEYDEVILVDLTISKSGDYSWMIDNAKKIIWIDHHESAINEVRSQGANFKADECHVGIGACVTAWLYFFPNIMMPLHVQLCGVYDVFDKSNTITSFTDAWYYQLYLNRNYQLNYETSDNMVCCASSLMTRTFVEMITCLDCGAMCEDERYNEETEVFKSLEESMYESFKVAKLIADGQPAMLIKSHSDNHTHDVFLIRSTELCTDTQYKVSIRVPENSDFNATLFAKKFGGGGHQKASGCLMTLEQWESL